ncbi:MAG: nucleotidyl transferase [Pelagibacterales bacterium]|nr:nucleotidyl transferase [Pelagibacterales bacterium]|tara:strand:+ start:6584 stop:7339 length:756 start_codon:yes stop_codon:yes gene_type:complete
MKETNRVVILAAGRGSRMIELTKNSPKCLVKINKRPILYWLIEIIENSTVNNIQIICGYLESMIKTKYKKTINKNWEKTNMVYSLFCSSEFNGSTIVSYSDIIYSSEYVNLLKDSQADFTILADKKWHELWSIRMDNPLNDAETFKSKDGYLTEIGGKANEISEIEAQYMGLFKLSNNGYRIMRNIFDSLTEDKRKAIDMTSMFKILIKKKYKIKVIHVSGKWIEADSELDVRIYNKQILNGENWLHDWRD